MLCRNNVANTAVVSSFLDEPSAGDKLVIATEVKNCNEIDPPFLVIIEVRNFQGVTENIGLQSGLLDGDGQTQIGVSWTSAYGGDYEVRAFAITNLDHPLILSPIATSNIEIAEKNTENPVLRFNATETDLSTAEPFGTTYYLVNNGRHTVTLTIDDYIVVPPYLNSETLEIRVV